MRFAVALAVLLASVAIWLLVRPGRVRALPWDASAARRLFMMGAIPPAHADGMVTGETDRAGLPFRRVGRVLLGLGDPAGAEGDKISAVWRLRDLARQEGLDPAFWRVGPGLLKVTPIWADAAALWGGTAGSCRTAGRRMRRGVIWCASRNGT